ncbi:hypothetical protein [uncultured Tateyamaria sp.]|uniref:hypothetical protein n=1 Tax=uncultured Tateyamaria sp. TaxID=455651 RepID=UPI002629AF03|nr:hypothetical protein [uncultured Tateyamaria sp.]
MSDAIRIFMHSFGMVFRDLGATLRATYVGVVMIVVGVVALLVILPDQFGGLMSQSADMTVTADMNLAGMFVGFFLIAIGYLTMIAAWHRYVLLAADQREGGFTPSAGIVIGYLGRSILLGLLIGILAIPVLIPVGIVGTATGSVLAGSIVAVPLFALLGWVLFRLSLILPACTIGHKMTLKESWQATAPYARTILGIVVLLVLINFGFELVTGALPLTSIIGGLISVVVSVLYALVSASILTTMYGVAVEGREI